jgi:hypothetical protein
MAMTHWADHSTALRTYSLLATAMLGLLLALGCNSRPSGAANHNSGAEQTTPAATNSAVPAIDLNCVYDHLQNPPESFHYIYKKDTSDNDHVEQEADVTPQAIDGFRRQMDGFQQPLHGVRSDLPSWQSALAGLTAIGGMSSSVAIINHSSAMKREADGGQVNGYDTIHYSIDTARFDTTERGMLLKPGEFEKGEAWVTSQGCPAKLILDSELHRNDGSLIEKIHYEEAMIKK